MALHPRRGRNEQGESSVVHLRFYWWPKEGRGGFGLSEFGRRPTAALRLWKEQEGTR